MEKRCRILVVDDDEFTRELICFELREKGFEVYCVGDGLHAILDVRTRKPDLVILDVMLPDFSGLELLNLFQGMEHTPVILISRMGQAKVMIAANKLGAADYIVKPFALELLMEKISNLPGFLMPMA